MLGNSTNMSTTTVGTAITNMLGNNTNITTTTVNIAITKMLGNSKNMSTTTGAFTFTAPYKPFEYKKVIGWLNLLVVVIGVIGNLSTIIVLCRKRWRGSSVAVFLLALALSDIMILWSSPLMLYLMLVFNIRIRSVSDAWCKLNIYVVYSSVMTSSWLLVGVTMERMTNVIFARKGKESWTQNIWTARILVIVIWVVIYAINLHFLDLMEGVPHHTGVLACKSLSLDYKYFLINILPWLDFTLVFAAPFVLIVIGNTITIYNLRKIPKASINTTSKTTAMSRTALTVTLIVLSVVYIVNMAPLTFYFIYAMHNPIKTHEQYFYYHFIFHLFHLFSNLNAAVNFFLYVISDANVRTDVKLILRRVFLCKQSDSEDIGMDETAPTVSEFKTNESAY